MGMARSALAVALIVAPTVMPHPTPVKLSLNACTMVPAKTLAAAGITAKCWQEAIQYDRFGMMFDAAWNRGKPRAASAYLGVSIVSFFSTSSSGYKEARQALTLGKLKKVSGIGTVAYESLTSGYTTGEESAALYFAAGNKIVSIGLDSSTPIKSLDPLHAIAKAIEKKL